MFCAAIFGALKPGFLSFSALKLVVNVVGELQTENKQLQHRAVSLRQDVFLTLYSFIVFVLNLSRELTKFI